MNAMKFTIRIGLPLSWAVGTGKARMGTATHAISRASMAIPPSFSAKEAKLTRLNTPQPLRRPVPAADPGTTMPPGFKAQVAQLNTFEMPERVTGSTGDQALGKALVDAWRRDGIIQIAMSAEQRRLWEDAKAASRRFFRKPHAEKAACIDSQSYSGYIASGEEVTDGIADYSEIFTITKDLDMAEPRVRAKWPCHGPCPWPDIEMKEPMTRYNESLGTEGEKLLQLAEFGLEVAPGSLTRHTYDGWHHTRVLR